VSVGTDFQEFSGAIRKKSSNLGDFSSADGDGGSVYKGGFVEGREKSQIGDLLALGREGRDTL
jgi:hypothetical protein